MVKPLRPSAGRLAMLVIVAGPTFAHIATNAMGELLMATPALSDGVMYVRSSASLFAIARRQ